MLCVHMDNFKELLISGFENPAQVMKACTMFKIKIKIIKSQIRQN